MFRTNDSIILTNRGVLVHAQIYIASSYSGVLDGLFFFFPTYYSILIFLNFSPIILFASPIILFISPIILNYAQSKQLSNRYITVLCETFIQHYTESLRL